MCSMRLKVQLRAKTSGYTVLYDFEVKQHLCNRCKHWHVNEFPPFSIIKYCCSMNFSFFNSSHERSSYFSTKEIFVHCFGILCVSSETLAYINYCSSLSKTRQQILVLHSFCQRFSCCQLSWLVSVCGFFPWYFYPRNEKTIINKIFDIHHSCDSKFFFLNETLYCHSFYVTTTTHSAHKFARLSSQLPFSVTCKIFASSWCFCWGCFVFLLSFPSCLLEMPHFPPYSQTWIFFRSSSGQ